MIKFKTKKKGKAGLSQMSAFKKVQQSNFSSQVSAPDKKHTQQSRFVSLAFYTSFSKIFAYVEWQASLPSPPHLLLLTSSLRNGIRWTSCCCSGLHMWRVQKGGGVCIVLATLHSKEGLHEKDSLPKAASWCSLQGEGRKYSFLSI